MAERFDILLVSEDGGYALANAMTNALLREYAARRIIVPTDEALGHEWVEIYAEPGVHGHEAFIKGAAPEEPIFLEFVFRFGDVKSALPFGGTDAWFFIEFRGALYPEVRADLMRRLNEILSTRLRCVSRPHDGLPPHLESERSPSPDPRRRRTGGVSQQVGTIVEEF